MYVVLMILGRQKYTELSDY